MGGWIAAALLAGFMVGVLAGDAMQNGVDHRSIATGFVTINGRPFYLKPVDPEARQ